jgi:hypothetical protein
MNSDCTELEIIATDPGSVITCVAYLPVTLSQRADGFNFMIIMHAPHTGLAAS